MVDSKSKLEKTIEQEGLTEEEVITLIRSGRSPEKQHRKLYISNRGVKYGYFSDPHIGHKEFKPELWDRMIRQFRREGVDFIVCPGDHLEGMSGRPGHIYELTHQGYAQQLAYAVDLYSQLPAPTFGIDGNHDQWYFKKNNGGAIVGDDLAARIKQYINLGQNEGDLELAPGITLRLFHPNDGSAYAISYKLQKLIESFGGGEKPDIVHEGHYHKALYMFLRNVHGFESGTLCGQSEWMRGKKIPAHVGFGIITAYYNKRGIDRLLHEFVPGYD